MFRKNNALWMVWRGVSGDERLFGARWTELSGSPSGGRWDAGGVLGGGAFNSTHAPSLAVVNDATEPTRVHMVWKGSGTDQRIFHTEELPTGPGRQVNAPSGPFHTTGRPGIAILNRQPVIAWRAPGNDAVMWSVRKPDRTWSEPQPTGAQSSHGPALATFGNTVFMVCKAPGDESAFWAKFDGGSWSAIKPLPVAGGAVLLSDTPALIPSLSGLTMAYKGTRTDSRIFLSDFQPGGTWSAPRPAVPPAGGIGTSHGPAIGTQRGVLRLAWKGVEGDQRVFSSAQQGSGWTVPGLINPGFNSAASPAMMPFIIFEL
jgi:hypothetical protein